MKSGIAAGGERHHGENREISIRRRKLKWRYRSEAALSGGKESVAKARIGICVHRRKTIVAASGMKIIVASAAYQSENISGMA